MKAVQSLFFQKKQRSPTVLTNETVLKTHSCFALGQDIEDICGQIGLNKWTVRKAVKTGLIVLPAQEDGPLEALDKSRRSALDSSLAAGKACTNVLERVLTMQTGASCPVSFDNQADLQHAGVLLALPALIAQGLLRYEEDFQLGNVYYPTSSVFFIPQAAFFYHWQYCPC